MATDPQPPDPKQHERAKQLVELRLQRNALRGERMGAEATLRIVGDCGDLTDEDTARIIALDTKISALDSEIAEIDARIRGQEPDPIRLPKLEQAILDLLEVADEPLTRDCIAGGRWPGGPGTGPTEEQQDLADCVHNISRRQQTIGNALRRLTDFRLIKPFSTKHGHVITALGFQRQKARRRSRR